MDEEIQVAGDGHGTETPQPEIPAGQTAAPVKEEEKKKLRKKPLRAEAPELAEIHRFDPTEAMDLYRAYADTQKLRIQAQLRYGNRLKREMEASTWPLLTPEEQNGRIMRIEKLKGLNRLRLEDYEEDMAFLLGKHVKNHWLWQEWLEGVHGIGPVLAGALLAIIENCAQQKVLTVDGVERWVTPRERLTALTPRLRAKDEWNDRDRKAVQQMVDDGTPLEKFTDIKVWLHEKRYGIACFPHPGHLYSYFGMAPRRDEDGTWHAPRRKRGEPLRYNPRARTWCFLAGESITKKGVGYRKLYEHARFKYDEQYPAIYVDKAGKQYTEAEVLAIAARRKAEQGPDPEEDVDLEDLEAAEADAEKQIGSFKLFSGWTRAHRYMAAKHWAVKILLDHAWRIWRMHSNLPVVPPFPIAKLGHTDWVEIIRE